LETSIKGKALGPDEIITKLFVCMWGVIGKEYVTTVQSSIQKGKFLVGVT
jgi:hypothetical protein